MSTFPRLSGLLIACFVSLLVGATSSTFSNPRGAHPSIGWDWSKVEFSSIDPDQTTLFLHFKLNKTGAETVVIGHDNGGITDNEIEYAKFMHGRGFNVFLTDRVTSRRRVARPNEMILMEDAFATTAYIKNSFKGKLDVENISYVSFSGDGGYGGLMAIEPLVRSRFGEMSGIDPALFKYKKVVAIYPHCVDLVGRDPDTPALIIGAELDSSDPRVCEKVYSRFPIVRVDIYPNAPHGFDQLKLRGKQFIKKPFQSPGRCVFTMDVRERLDWGGFRYFLQTTPDGVKQRTKGFMDYLQTCQYEEFGYWSFYDAELTRRAYEDSVNFIRD